MLLIIKVSYKLEGFCCFVIVYVLVFLKRFRRGIDFFVDNRLKDFVFVDCIIIFKMGSSGIWF